MSKLEGVVGSMSEWAKSRPDTEAVDLTEIDPEGLVQIKHRELGGKPTHEWPITGHLCVTVVCQTLTEWVTQARQRKAAGHTLHPADSPKQLMVGFVDEQAQEEILLSIRTLKHSGDDEYKALGIRRKDLGTVVGRAAATQTDRFFLWERGVAVHEADPILEEAWSHLRKRGSEPSS